jgi:hypothetical protein
MPERRTAWDRLFDEPDAEDAPKPAPKAKAPAKPTDAPEQTGLSKLFIVRLFDMFDGWIDITGPMSKDEADAVWRDKTGGGTHHTQFSDGDYYRVFPADTRMLVTPEYLGR